MVDGSKDEPVSDESAADETVSDGAVSDGTATEPTSQPTRRPTAAASAASRARRIGGARTSSAPSSAAATAGTADTASDGVTSSGSSTGSGSTPKPVATTKPVSTQKSATKTSATKKGGATAPAEVEPEVEPAGKRAVVEVPAWLRWVPAGVLSACAIAMIVLALVAAHGVWYSKPSASALRDQVLAAAKTCTATSNTYSYTSIPQDEKKGLACSTGTWTEQYRKAITNIVKPAATRLKASQSIQINRAGIESVSSDGQQWMVVVYGQTKITQSADPKPVLGPFSAVVRMQHVGSSWLIAHIDLIVNPSS